VSNGDAARADAAVARQRLRAAGGAQARDESRSDISQRDGRALPATDSRSSVAFRFKITSQTSAGALRAPLKLYVEEVLTGASPLLISWEVRGGRWPLRFESATTQIGPVSSPRLA
jgi:hypothetical protein